MQPTFIKIDNRYLNLSAIKLIKIYEEGTLRIFTDVPNAETPGAFYYYDVDDAEHAQQVLKTVGPLTVNN